MGRAFDGPRVLNENWGNWSARLSWNDVLVGDFDADGRDDIAGRAGETWWVARSTGSAFNSTPWGSWSREQLGMTSRLRTLTATVARTLSDEPTTAPGGLLRSTGTSFHNERWGGWDRTRTWSDVCVVDLDLDGREDLAGRSGNQWWVALSTGADFTTGLWGAWPSLSHSEDVQAGRYHW